MTDKNSRLVYSTDGQHLGAQTESHASAFAADGIVRLRRETKGRKGAGVITIHGVPAAQQKTIASQLKMKCGTGGALKDGIIEIQGDKRQIIETELANAGFTTRWVGG